MGFNRIWNKFKRKYHSTRSESSWRARTSSDRARLEFKDRVLILGVLFVISLTSLQFIPKMYEGGLSNQVYYLIEFSLYSLTSLILFIHFFLIKTGFGIMVMRSVAIMNCFWYGWGVWTKAENIIKEDYFSGGFANTDLHDKLQLVYAAGIMFTVVLEILLMKRR